MLAELPQACMLFCCVNRRPKPIWLTSKNSSSFWGFCKGSFCTVCGPLSVSIWLCEITLQCLQKIWWQSTPIYILHCTANRFWALSMCGFGNEKNTDNRLTLRQQSSIKTMSAQTVIYISDISFDLVLMTKKNYNISLCNCHNVHQSVLAYYWCPLLFKSLTAFSLFFLDILLLLHPTAKAHWCV